jgi:UDP-N-acetylglucosamine 2-epimerase (non-hydrolysing)
VIVVTAHRKENLGAPLERICEGVRRIAVRYSDDVSIVFPVHLNPRVQKTVNDILGGIPNVHLTEPLDYLTFIHLMKSAYLILTDSGGIQEEAPSLNVPVLVMRDVTERPEALEAGATRLVGADADRIEQEARRLLDDLGSYRVMTGAVNPYGDGQAAGRIVARLLKDA